MRKTLEQFKQDVITKYGDRWVLDKVDYKGNKIKVEMVCKDHGSFWIIPNNLLSGHGCPKCSYELKSMTPAKTNEDFKQDIIKVHGNKFLLDRINYKSCNEKIEIGCQHHGYWFSRPLYILRGNGCKKCAIEETAKKRLKTTEGFKQEVISNFGDKWLLDRVDYKGVLKKIKVGCKTHGYFTIRPTDLLHGSGCPKCAGKNKTTKEFNQEVISNFGDKWILDKVNYKSARSKIKVGCKIHGYWEVAPNNLLYGRGCPKCAGDNLSQTNEEFKNKIIKKFGDKWILDKVEYKRSNIKIKVGCKTHGYFLTTPAALYNGQGCPKCNSSKGEEKIAKWLGEHNIEYIPQYRFKDCKNKNPLPFDFYIPSKNTVIEFDGEQHYKPIKHFGGENRYLERVLNDRKKSNYCWENNITLIRIPYHYSDFQIESNLLILLR
jgi:hypothetical protein